MFLVLLYPLFGFLLASYKAVCSTLFVRSSFSAYYFLAFRVILFEYFLLLYCIHQNILLTIKID